MLMKAKPTIEESLILKKEIKNRNFCQISKKLLQTSSNVMLAVDQNRTLHHPF